MRLKRKHFSYEQQINFFEEYEEKNPSIQLFLMVISLGLYSIFWFYNMNREMQKIDYDTPDPQRCIVVMLFLPISWFLTHILLKETLPEIILPYLNTMNFLLWSLFIFLILKYIFDFCESFGRVTSSPHILWYLYLYPGFFSYILPLFGFYYSIPLVFFTMITIPSMQAFINSKKEEISYVKQREHFNTMYREGKRFNNRL